MMTEKGHWSLHFFAGGIAGAVSRSITAPIDRLKTQLQVHVLHKIPLRSEMKQIYIQEGIRGFWKGNTFNVVKATLDMGLKFSVYEEIKDIFISDHEVQSSYFAKIAGGSASGAVCQTVVYPIDVVKTKVMTTNMSTPDIFRQLMKTGLSGFYRGYTPGILAAIPFNTIDLTSYEIFKGTLMGDRVNVPPWIPIISGAGSSSLALLFTYPLFLARTIMQAGVTKKGCIHILWQIYKERSFVALYSGYTLQASKLLPASMITYLVYELMAKELGIKMR